MFPFPGQFGMPMPGMMPGFLPPTDMYGKTRYKYVTPDGGPPNAGAVPVGSAADPNPFAAGNFGHPGFNPYGPPNSMAGPPCPFGAPPAPWWAGPPAPPPYYSGPPTPAPPTSSHKIPRPPPPASHSFGGTDEEAEEPLEGNRVKGQLASFPDTNSGYIFPQNNVTIHLFSQNVLTKYPPRNNMITIRNDKFNVQHAPCDMTMEELIIQIDCEKRANYHSPYNRPGHGYPRHLIGVQELLEMGGGGRFMLGTKIMLTDCQAKSRLGDLWSDASGNAGQEKPRYLVRLPV